MRGWKGKRKKNSFGRENGRGEKAVRGGRERKPWWKRAEVTKFGRRERRRFERMEGKE